MKNFGFTELCLVNPPELSDECFKRSKHAKDVIMDAINYSSLDEVIEDIDFLVGTTGIINLNDKHHIRNPITPRQLSDYAKRLDSRVGLLFGREDYGLYQEELMKCDLLVSIHTNDIYPIMNLSHAVAVVLYELASADIKFNIQGHRKTSKYEREKFFEQFKDFLDTVDYPRHKRENTEILFRRLLGRATLSKWEFHTLMGVFGRANERLEINKKKKDEIRLQIKSKKKKNSNKSKKSKKEKEK
jgi:TrmH family RNA methyltransferase